MQKKMQLLKKPLVLNLYKIGGMEYEKITVGVVGAGIYGNYHIHTFICDPNVERVVFCDLNRRKKMCNK